MFTSFYQPNFARLYRLAAMALILHIDTALQKAYVGLSEDGKLLHEVQNDTPMNHAAFVQPAIQDVLKATGLSLNEIDAVGVTGGPGSYTGLRVAMASAKGLCYALQKPLLSVSTLQALACAAINRFPGNSIYCPMIDARRNEVFTALYDEKMNVLDLPHALILEPSSFSEAMKGGRVIYFGSGAVKWQQIMLPNSNAGFETVDYDGLYLSFLLFNSFKNKQFKDLAYAEPDYLKDFYFGNHGA